MTAPVELGSVGVTRGGRLGRAARGVVRSKGALVGLIVLTIAGTVAIAAPVLAPYPIDQIALEERLMPPVWNDGGSWDHPLGTDALGRDELSRLISGARVSMATGLLVVLMAGAFGTALGMVAGYVGGLWESAIMRTLDASIAFPGLLLALIVLTMVGPGQATVVIVLAAVTWMIFAKVAHDVVLVLRETPFVRAAEAVGCTNTRIIVRHLLPNLAPSLLTIATLEFAGVVLAEAALSYLGFGIQPPAASWGLMIAEGQEYLTTAGWLVVIPGVAIALVVLALNLVAAWLRVQTDPRQRAHRLAAGRPHLHPARPAEPRREPMQPTPAEAPLLEVGDLHIEFPLGDDRVVHAVRGIDFSIRPGETLGLVGESGSGKSVTALALLDLVPPPGRVTATSLGWRGAELVNDRAGRAALVGSRITIVFQDPTASLNPLLAAGEQLAEVLRKHRGMGRRAARARAVELLDLVGISSPEQRARQYPFEFSGGMAQRAMLAMALAPEPDLIVADEPTTALDVTIQAQILELLESVQREFGMSVLLIAHDLGVVARLCDRIAVMYAGRIVEEAPADRLFAAARHPYTAGLIASTPRLDRPRGSHTTPLRGSVLSPTTEVKGCAFAPRCERASPRCLAQRPELEPVGAAHRSACWHPLEEDVP